MISDPIKPLCPDATPEQRAALDEVMKKFSEVFADCVLPLHVVQPPETLPSSVDLAGKLVLWGLMPGADGHKSSIQLQVMKDRLAAGDERPFHFDPLQELKI